MNSDQEGFRETIPHNLKKKKKITKPFTNMKDFPILLNLIVLHHDSFILLLAFLLVRLSIFLPIFLRDFFLHKSETGVKVVLFPIYY